MRIAVILHSAHLVGGAEAYVDAVIPELRQAGHEVAVCTEAGGASPHRPLDSTRVAAPFVLTDADALGRLASWRPDVLFMHGLQSCAIERALIDSHPAVFMAHAYHGTCISGSKTRSLPRPTPCSRTLGPGCAIQYFPRRCGGLSPVTLLEQYRLQRQRQRVLPRYARVLALSEHIRLEYVRHGVAPDRAWVLPYFAPPIDLRQREGVVTGMDAPVRLLFAGRMENLKGGSTLLAALPRIAAALSRPVSVVFAGDGRRRAAWEQHAAKVTASHAAVRIEFVGWLPQPELERVLLKTDLLVVPSIWPEPFGLVGPQAAAAGVPAAAFATGGIPQWLTDGVTGHLASDRATTPLSLARAAIRCLENREHFAALQRQAQGRAAEHTLAAHVQALLGHLRSAAGQQTHNTA